MLSKITRDEADSETYTWAQFGLGAAYAASGKLDEAITAWSKITRDEADSETYTQAQLGLGTAYAESGKLDEACILYTSPSPREGPPAPMPSSA